MLQRRAAEAPKRVLQALRQGDEALAAQHDLGMAPAAERQAEVVQQVRERLAGDRDAEFGAVGEVRQPLLTRRMLLPEDHLLLRPVQRLPMADPAFEGAADAIGEVGVATPQFAQDSHRAQAGSGAEHWHNLAVPDRGQRIGSSTSAGLALVRRRAGIGLKAGARAGTEPGLGGQSGGCGFGGGPCKISPADR